MNKKLEIAVLSGGSGFLGVELGLLLKNTGYKVRILSRMQKNVSKSFFHWNPAKAEIDQSVFKDAGVIINLAGAGIADKRWTQSRKQVLLESRTESLNFLYDELSKQKHSIHTLVSASAIGYYGDRDDEWLKEDDKGGEGFLPDTCREWEKAALQFQNLGIRVVILRIGIVLSEKGGALPVMALPVKYFAGAALGSGNQYMSWIHIDDLSGIFKYAIENEHMNGVYNAVASFPVSNREFFRQLAKVLNRPLWPVNVPSLMLKAILGEKAAIVLEGQRVSNEKLHQANFNFKHENLFSTLQSLLKYH
ncbi:MAG: TIGR01777 family protein [Bacteroidetes bacterium]|nr:MAG: TIGR01777 family protein [Bacteroidota bacterium]REK03397.1 MAG: TIGR01777 family protein [Bacteroidota bacterium]REK34491.1 MAG: TIGR01777 family protein [Bacteroidota bacterium]REK50391.1 MAG: TIGR01777 family protein [Bacteroidota bacterium]